MVVRRNPRNSVQKGKQIISTQNFLMKNYFQIGWTKQLVNSKFLDLSLQIEGLFVLDNTFHF